MESEQAMNIQHVKCHKEGSIGIPRFPNQTLEGQQKLLGEKCLRNRQELGDMVEDGMEGESDADGQKSSYKDMETTERSVSRWFRMSECKAESRG